MPDFNSVHLVGHLTRDPELKSAGESVVCKLGLAVNSSRGADREDEVCFVDIDVWGKSAEACAKFLKKGRPVLVDGRLRLSTWEKDDGEKRSKHSVTAARVIFLGGKPPEEKPEEGADVDLPF